jgi:hypothetical protein
MRSAVIAILITSVLLGMLLVTSDAAACSPIPNQLHEIDPAEADVDRTPPSVVATVGPVYRGHGYKQTGACSWSGDSCMDSGSFSINVKPTDDRTSPERMGYIVRLVDGNPPGLAENQLGIAIRSSYTDGSMLVFYWDDGATDDQEPIDFTLEVTPIDLAGNEGEPVLVEVHDPGSGGCGAGSPLAGHLGITLLAVLASIVLRTGRRG